MSSSAAAASKRSSRRARTDEQDEDDYDPTEEEDELEQEEDGECISADEDEYPAYGVVLEGEEASVTDLKAEQLSYNNLTDKHRLYAYPQDVCDPAPGSVGSALAKVGQGQIKQIDLQALYDDKTGLKAKRLHVRWPRAVYLPGSHPLHALPTVASRNLTFTLPLGAGNQRELASWAQLQGLHLPLKFPASDKDKPCRFTSIPLRIKLIDVQNTTDVPIGAVLETPVSHAPRGEDGQVLPSFSPFHARSQPVSTGHRGRHVYAQLPPNKSGGAPVLDTVYTLDPDARFADPESRRWGSVDVDKVLQEVRRAGTQKVHRDGQPETVEMVKIKLTAEPKNVSEALVASYSHAVLKECKRKGVRPPEVSVVEKDKETVLYVRFPLVVLSTLLRYYKCQFSQDAHVFNEYAWRLSLDVDQLALAACGVRNPSKIATVQVTLNVESVPYGECEPMDAAVAQEIDTQFDTLGSYVKGVSHALDAEFRLPRTTTTHPVTGTTRAELEAWGQHVAAPQAGLTGRSDQLRSALFNAALAHPAASVARKAVHAAASAAQNAADKW